MKKYIAHANEQENVKNPIGFAVSMAQQNGVKGPPENEDSMSKKITKCYYCGHPAIKKTTHNKELIGLCDAHLAMHRKLNELIGFANEKAMWKAINEEKNNKELVPHAS